MEAGYKACLTWVEKKILEFETEKERNIFNYFEEFSLKGSEKGKQYHLSHTDNVI